MVALIHHHFMGDIVATIFLEQCHLSATNCYYFSDRTNQVQLEDLKCSGMVLLKVIFIYSENFGFDSLKVVLRT